MRSLVALTLAAGGLLAGLLAVPGQTAAAAATAPTAPAAEPMDQVVLVTATPDALVASTTAAVPGVVRFAVTGAGSAVLLQLGEGYPLERLYADYAKAIAGRKGAIRRLRQGATFHGGMAGRAEGPGRFAVELAAGSYQLADLAHGHAVPFEVRDVARSRRRAPVTAGTVSYTPLAITMPRTMPRRGWMRVVNQGTQVSRMDLVLLKPGTTEAQVRAHYRSGGRLHRGRFTGTVDRTLLLSPGQRYWWQYSLAAGPVAAASPWPRPKDGAPQSQHEMWGLTQLQ